MVAQDFQHFVRGHGIWWWFRLAGWELVDSICIYIYLIIYRSICLSVAAAVRVAAVVLVGFDCSVNWPTMTRLSENCKLILQVVGAADVWAPETGLVRSCHALGGHGKRHLSKDLSMEVGVLLGCLDVDV